MSTLLLTGFEGYGGRGVNPAQQVANILHGETLLGTTVNSAILPVDYSRLSIEMTALVRSRKPCAVICIGLWPGESMIRLERIGININDFEIPDNNGNLEVGVINAAGPNARIATLPLSVIQTNLLDAGIPARLSSTAGNFLCNALLYKTLAIVEQEGNSVPTGFIHVPYLPSQVADMIHAIKTGRDLELHQRADTASMELQTMLAAVRIAIETTLKAVA